MTATETLAATARAIIAVDGPAAAGKGTLARRLAAALDLPYLDTGLLYRATARRVIDEGGDPGDAQAAEAAARALEPGDLGRSGLRAPDTDTGASKVAAIPGVRAALLDFQRQFGRAGGAVLDGRDIGTVVFPDASVKLFVTASPEARAERRWKERRARGEDVPLAAVTAEMAARDARDASRDTAPMKPAEDAILLDTTGLDAEAAYAEALRLVRQRLGLAG
ncbi:d(CMP) kinase [Roseomonas gilardii]|uniref:(d)CMP kinase n=1 Tax=Roseomonas gilardii TaxID=257708 RepID=UPI0011A2BDE3|nr:d(CMP) kinase [Roseomonas gilardii]